MDYLLLFKTNDKTTIYIGKAGKASKHQPKYTGADKLGDGETFSMAKPEPIKGLKKEFNNKKALADKRGTIKSVLQMMYKGIPDVGLNC